MKNKSWIILAFTVLSGACSNAIKEESQAAAIATEPTKTRHLFMDVHNLEPGKVTFEAVACAHQKDLAIQGKYDVSFIKYWVDATKGKAYCLARAEDPPSVYRAHKQDHGLLPDLVSPAA